MTRRTSHSSTHARSRVGHAAGLTLALSLALSGALTGTVSGPSGAAIALPGAAAGGATHSGSAAVELTPVSSVVEDGVRIERFGQRIDGLPVYGGERIVRTRVDGTRARTMGSSGRVFNDLRVDADVDIPSRVARSIVERAYRGAAYSPDLSIVDHGLVVLPDPAQMADDRVMDAAVARRFEVRGSYADGRPLRRDVFVGTTRRILMDITTISPGFMSGQSAETAQSSSAAGTVRSADPSRARGAMTTTGVGYQGAALPLALDTSGAKYLFQDRTRPMWNGSTGQIRTYDADGNDPMAFMGDGVPHGIKVVESSQTPVPATPDNGAVDAHWGAAQVYEFYRALGRNGLDGKGGDINSVVGVTEGNGRGLENAFWQGSLMVYGAKSKRFKPFSASLDVVGHELTHGVIEHSSDLVYFGQPGAINEALADYFGNAVQNSVRQLPGTAPGAGLLGEDLCLDKTPAQCAIRNLDKVETTQADFIGTTEDDGGVHLNSGIVAGAWWQIRRDLGAEVADPLVYRVMTQYLTPWASFLQAREQTLAAARESGLTAEQQNVVAAAFDAHGITEGWEQQVGLSGAELFPHLSVTSAFPSASGSRWATVISDKLDGPATVVMGDVRQPGTFRKLDYSGKKLAFDTAQIGSKYVVWAASGLKRDEAQIRYQPVSGGKKKLLKRMPGRMVWDVQTDASTIAWVSDSVAGSNQLWVRRPNGALARPPLPREASIDNLVVSGNRVYWSQSLDAARSNTTDIRQYDARTGASRLVTRLVNRDKRRNRQPFVEGIAPVGQVLYYGADRIGDGMLVGLERVDVRTGRVKVLIPETSKRVMRISRLTATAQAVSFGEQALPSNDPAKNLPKIWQVKTDGSGLRQFSCSRGEQVAPAATAGRGLIFIDATAGDVKLMYRPSPQGPCS